MVRNIDGTTILYGIGAVLGIAAVLYFGQEVLLSLSPTIKSGLLFLAFSVFLIAGIHLGKNTINTALVVLSVGTYIVFLGYTIFRFRPSTNTIFLALAASSALFIGIAYAVNERELTLTQDQVKYIIGGGLILAALLITGDVLGPQASTTTEFADTVNLSSATDGRITIGTVQSDNPFIFSRTVDYPRYRACLVTSNATKRLESHANIDSRQKTLLSGWETATYNITARFPVAASAPDQPSHPDLPSISANELETVPVIQAEECPDTRDEPALIVTEQSYPD